jgi:hypothetical protein
MGGKALEAFAEQQAVSWLEPREEGRGQHSYNGSASDIKLGPTYS